MTYRPIACGVHDHLEHWTVRQTPVRATWRAPDGLHTAVTTLADVFARDGADWVQLATGDTVRADHLVSVEPV